MSFGRLLVGDGQGFQVRLDQTTQRFHIPSARRGKAANEEVFITIVVVARHCRAAGKFRQIFILFFLVVMRQGLTDAAAAVGCAP